MKNTIKISALFVFVSLLGFALLANAQGDSRNNDQQGKPLQQSINIEPNGQAVVHGTLLSATGSTLTVKSWGVSFTVDISKANVAPRGATTTPVFVAGDFVDVSGRMSTTTTGIIAARNVRDVTAEQRKLRGGKNNRMSTSTSERGDNNIGSTSPEREGNRGQQDEQGQGNQPPRRGGVIDFFRGLFGK